MLSGTSFPTSHPNGWCCFRKGPYSRKVPADPRKLPRISVIADHVLIRRNVEEGWKGEVVALVVKDLHTQFRCVYPATSKSSDECCKAFQHFIGPQDEVEVIYTDNAPELKSAVEYLGYRHQTSIEYMDSTKSFVEREVRQMLEGCRTNLVQSGLPERYWRLAMQHFASAHFFVGTRPWPPFALAGGFIMRALVQIRQNGFFG